MASAALAVLTAAPPKLEALVELWLDRFGTDRPVQPRDALNRVIDEAPALLGLVSETFALHPHPPEFVRYLRRVENLPVSLPSGRFRLARSGHRWKVLKLRA